MKRYLFFAICAAMLIAIGCAQNDNSMVLARVNGEAITVNDFEVRLSNLPPYYRTFAQQNKQRFLDDIIAERLFAQEAMKEKVDQDKEVKSLIKQAKEKIMVSKLITEKVDKKVFITDDQIKEFYESHKDQFMVAEKIRACHILVDSEKKANDILKQLKAGADFASLAREQSQDASKDNGGDLGYFTKGQMIPEFEEACWQLEVGHLSQPVKTKLGYHIIIVTDRLGAQLKSFDEVKEFIKGELTKLTRNSEFERYLKGLKDKSRIEIIEKNLGLIKEDEKQPK